MPIIVELEDGYVEESPDDCQLASRALGTCLLVRNGQLPVEVRYSSVLSTFPPIEKFLASTPKPDISKLELGLFQLLRPRPELSPELTSFDPEDAESRIKSAIRDFQTLSTLLLSYLKRFELNPTLELALTLASFSSLDDSWTTLTTKDIAVTLLKKYEESLSTPEILIDGILTATLKPLFATQTPSTSRLTAAARLSIREPSTSITIDTPPWVTHLPAAPTLLTYTLTHLPSTSLDTAWPLLIPPILTITDSTSVPTRTRGIELIHLLLNRLAAANSTLLTRTGLAPLFWDSVKPAFSYLPPLTPVTQSLPLLSAAFRCLRRLAEIWKTDRKERAKLQDQIFRDGFAHGITFGGEIPAVVETLCTEAQGLVEDMGIYTVRHLRMATKTCADILANPLGNAEPRALVEACRLLRKVMRVAWPRVPAHAAEVLRGCTLCWRRVGEDEGDGVGGGLRVVEEVRKTVEMLGVVVQKDDPERWNGLKEGICKVDEGFEGMFAVDERENK